MVLLRQEVGNALRSRRRALGRTLRDVSAESSVSLGYLSEIERGEKEASSELLASICHALQLPLSEMLVDVSGRVAHEEAKSQVVVPMTAAAGTGRARVRADAA